MVHHLLPSAKFIQYKCPLEYLRGMINSVLSLVNPNQALYIAHLMKNIRCVVFVIPKFFRNDPFRPNDTFQPMTNHPDKTVLSTFFNPYSMEGRLERQQLRRI